MRSVRVDEALKDESSTVAKAHDRAGAQPLRCFMRNYVKQQQKTTAYDALRRPKVQQSRASAEAGNLVPAADVEAKFAACRAKTRRRLDPSK